MITTREQAAEACTQLSLIAAKMIAHLNNLQPQQSEVAHFFKGVVVRTGVHLKDSAVILQTNHDQHISSAFVIFRVLLDDVLRACYVYASPDRQRAVDDLTAKAYKDWFKTWKEAARLNQKLQLGDALTDALVDAERDKFMKSQDSDPYVSVDAQNARQLRNGVRADEMIRAMEQCPRVATYARAYVLFKLMSHYVHFSMLPYQMDRAKHSRALEIQFVDEVMFLAYHLLKVATEVLAETNAQLTWPTSPADTRFDRPTYLVKQP